MAAGVKAQSPAVDVVWFSDPEQTVPILMFEIETTPAASLSNNAIKVLGKDSSVLLKPLFFFHLVVKGGRQSSRIETVENTFHSHNYEIYLLNEGDALRFLREILTQHRRLGKHLDLLNVIRTVLADWKVNLSQFLTHVELLGFHIRYLEVYALLSERVPACREAFFRYLLNSEKTHVRAGCEYSRTYVGSNWATPIHFALLANKDESRRDEHVKKLRDWQEEGSYMTFIGPHWGLSQDYDEFIARLSPFLWAVIADLLKGHTEGQIWICDQMISILKTMSRPLHYVTFFHAVWLLHISSACNYQNGFEFARQWINRRGGVGAVSLLSPPAIVYDEDTDEKWIFNGEVSDVPDMMGFRALTKAKRPRRRTSLGAVDVALRGLVHPLDHAYADAIVEHLDETT